MAMDINKIPANLRKDLCIDQIHAAITRYDLKGVLGIE